MDYNTYAKYLLFIYSNNQEYFRTFVSFIMRTKSYLIGFPKGSIIFPILNWNTTY